MRIKQSPRLTLLQGGAGVEGNGSASTIFGPVKAGLTTSHRTRSQALSELLNELERQIDDLEYRYLEVLDTLSTDIIPRVVRLRFITEQDTIRNN